MEKNQNLPTIIFVLVIGLIGGYMLAQHAGHAAKSHMEMHETLHQENHDRSGETHLDSEVGTEAEVQ